METNDIIEVLNHHRTIRDFTDQAVDPQLISQIITTAQQTSTSQFLQSYSIVSITKPDLQEKIGQITGNEFVKSRGHLLIMLADQHRNALLAESLGRNTDVLHGADRFLAAVEDATLMTQSMIMVAESLGLGAVVLGSIFNDGQKLLDWLKLPLLTFPVIGLQIGYPASVPETKPRLPEVAMHFENQYQEPKHYQRALFDYDQTLAKYYAARSTHNRKESFAHLLSNTLAYKGTRAQMLSMIQRQGFLIEDKEGHIK